MSDYLSFFLSGSRESAQLELIDIAHPSFLKTYRKVRNARKGVTINLGIPIKDFQLYSSPTYDVPDAPFVAPQTDTGVLCHFDEDDGNGFVVSAVGPNFTNAVVLDTASPSPKFGVKRGGHSHLLPLDIHGNSNVKGRVSKSWRLQGWFWVTQPQTPILFLSFTQPGTYNFGLSTFSFFNDSAFLSESTNAAFTGGGRYGTSAMVTNLNAWNHIGCQYNAKTGEFQVFCNGHVVTYYQLKDFFGTGFVKELQVGGTYTFVDEVFLDFEEEEKPTLYEYLPMKIAKLGDRDDLDNGIQVSFGDLGKIIPKEIQRVQFEDSFGIKATATFRVYDSQDLTKPLYGPLVYKIKTFSVKREGATFEAKAPELNYSATGLLYRLDVFPMLRGSL